MQNLTSALKKIDISQFSSEEIELLNQFNKISQNIQKPTSDIFVATTPLIIPPHPKSFRPHYNEVVHLLLPVVDYELEKGRQTPKIDSQICNDWGLIGSDIDGFDHTFSVVLYKLLKDTEHRELLTECKKLHIKTFYTFLQAILIIRQAILSGKADTNELIVHFKVRSYNQLHYLYTSKSRYQLTIGHGIMNNKRSAGSAVFLDSIY